MSARFGDEQIFVTVILLETYGQVFSAPYFLLEVEVQP